MADLIFVCLLIGAGFQPQLGTLPKEIVPLRARHATQASRKGLKTQDPAQGTNPYAEARSASMPKCLRTAWSIWSMQCLLFTCFHSSSLTIHRFTSDSSAFSPANTTVKSKGGKRHHRDAERRQLFKILAFFTLIRNAFAGNWTRLATLLLVPCRQLDAPCDPPLRDRLAAR